MATASPKSSAHAAEPASTPAHAESHTTRLTAQEPFSQPRLAAGTEAAQALAPSLARRTQVWAPEGEVRHAETNSTPVAHATPEALTVTLAETAS